MRCLNLQFLHSFVIVFCRFSPDDKLIAVGSSDCTLDFYELDSNSQLKRTGYCKQIPTYIIQLDFSCDGKYVQVGTGSYERLVFEVATGTVVDSLNVVKKITWQSWTRYGIV